MTYTSSEENKQALDGLRCSECGRIVGAMLDINGMPRQFRCPTTGRLAEPQVPVHRNTGPLTLVARLDVLQQLGKRVATDVDTPKRRSRRSA
jgi:hypothetical protein